MIAPRRTTRPAAGRPPRSRALRSASQRRARPLSPDNSADVTDRHDDEQREEEDEADRVDRGLELRRESLAEDAGDEDEEEATAIEARERDDIQHREVHGQQADELEVRADAELLHLSEDDEVRDGAAIALDLQRDLLFRARLLPYVIHEITGPRDRAVVDLPHDIALHESRERGGRVRHHLGDLDVARRTRRAGRERDRERGEREYDVHRDTGDEHDRLHPPRLRGERARMSFALLMDREVVLPEDAHVAAERDRADRIVDLVHLEAEEPRAEADRELEDLHAEQPRRGVVPELVDRDDERERDEEEDDVTRIGEERAHQRSTGSSRSAPRTSASM